MSKTVIKAENLGKSYIIGHEKRERYTALRDVMVNKIKLITGKTRQIFKGGQLIAGDELEEFWALKDLNFEIKQGDRVGIIGRNGAGKSTLLKVLSRITEPTTGRIQIKGRVASLLEVGTGFHPELTGRENIFLNGAILGMSRAEIKKKFDEIVDFSGVEKFLDTPVKRYSSGMYVRLAFAVAAHLDPEILVVDEVLAVGDAEFQKKCLGKMEDVSTKEGRTVLFVSHNMGAVEKLCTTAMMLKNGTLSKYDDVTSVIEEYLSSNEKKSTFLIKHDSENIQGYAYKVQIEDLNNKPLEEVPVGSAWQVRIYLKLLQKTNYFILGIGFKTSYDLSVRTVYSKRYNLEAGDYQLIFKEREIIMGTGIYNMVIGLSSYEKPIQYIENAGVINITEINSQINNDQIIRYNTGCILNTMDTELIKV